MIPIETCGNGNRWWYWWIVIAFLGFGMDVMSAVDSVGITRDDDPSAGGSNLADSNYIGFRAIVPQSMTTDSLIWYGYRGFDGVDDTLIIAVYSVSANSANSRLAVSDTLFVTATSDTRHKVNLSGLSLTLGDSIFVVMFELNQANTTGCRYTHNEDDNGAGLFGGLRNSYPGTLYAYPPTTLTGAVHGAVRWPRMALYGSTPLGQAVILGGNVIGGGN